MYVTLFQCTVNTPKWWQFHRNACTCNPVNSLCQILKLSKFTACAEEDPQLILMTTTYNHSKCPAVLALLLSPLTQVVQSIILSAVCTDEAWRKTPLEKCNFVTSWGHKSPACCSSRWVEVRFPPEDFSVCPRLENKSRNSSASWSRDLRRFPPRNVFFWKFQQASLSKFWANSSSNTRLKDLVHHVNINPNTVLYRYCVFQTVNAVSHCSLQTNKPQILQK